MARSPTHGVPPLRNHSMAVWSLVSSVLGFFCLWGLGGLLGVGLGIMARSEIERSPAPVGGKALATAGIILGAVNVVLTVAALGAGIALLGRPSPVASGPAPMAAPPPPAPAPAPGPGPAAAHAPAAPGASRDERTLHTRLGSIDLVDLGGDVPSLNTALDAQRAEAKKTEQILLLWLVSPDCEPCNGVAAALTDPLMQRALSGVRLLRVDVRSFAFELQDRGIPTDKIPGFALLRSDNRPADYLNGGEWDADVAKNIAPVLGEFVRGRYNDRRSPWTGPRRDDETSL